MKKLGFGCMRLPRVEGPDSAVDKRQLCRMVDTFLSEGFDYFDLARSYTGRQNEEIMRECLTRRHPRDSYVLTDKLTGFFFKKEEEIPPLFEDQLRKVGVEYFDYYLMHAMNTAYYDQFSRCNAFELVKRFQAEGKIGHIGISFHDKPALLQQILTEHPEIEIVQIQFNYADYDSPTIESRAVYETCRKFNKKIFVMEPVKGGGLADLPGEARAILDRLEGGSPASYAIRYAASFEGVERVLSGMSSYDQLMDNIGFMKNFQPLTQQEHEAVARVREILKRQHSIPCTACRYCVDGCPQHILIPELFGCYNAKRQYNDRNGNVYYSNLTMHSGKASGCIGCRQCERACPQHLPIVSYLKEVASTFET